MYSVFLCSTVTSSELRRCPDSVLCLVTFIMCDASSMVSPPCQTFSCVRDVECSIEYESYVGGSLADGRATNSRHVCSEV